MVKHYSKFTQEELDAKLELTCKDAGISGTIAGILDSNGIFNLGMLLQHPKEKLLSFVGVSDRTIEHIYEVLKNHGFY